MQIDWVTISAQVLNFVILVWLMKRFLYKPILQAIDAREKLIARQVCDAADQAQRATEERAELEKKNNIFDEQRAELLRMATQSAETERQRLIAQAKSDEVDVRARREVAIQRDARDLTDAIAEQTRTEVFSIVRKVLADLATTSLEASMTDAFARTLRGLDEKRRATIGAERATASDPVIIRSAFEIPTAQHDLIQEVLNGVFSTKVHTRFEVTEELIAGIELSTNGQTVAWSINDYLRSLESRIAVLMGEKGDMPAEVGKAPPSNGRAHE